METKICKKCNKQKELKEFYFLKQKEKYRNICKECEIKRNMEYQQANSKKYKEYKREYNKKYRNENKENIKEYQKEYRQNNKEKAKKYSQEYREKNKKYFDEYFKKNKRKYKKHKKEKTIEEKQIIKFKQQLRCLISKSFSRKKYIKNIKTKDIIGCEFDFFYNYLLSTYKNNYGYEWDEIEKVHIDHIIPLATAKTKEEVIKLNHYTNLQLLKAKDNWQKRDKLDWKITI